MAEIRCPSCDQVHALGEVEGSCALPDVAASLTRFWRFFRVRNDGNFCTVDRKRYFVRGFLGFPVHGWPDGYCWGMWAEVDRPTYLKMQRRWDSSSREVGDIHAGKAANELPVFGTPLLGLPISISLQPIGQASNFLVLDVNHPAFLEQREGISISRAMGFNHWVLGLGTQAT